MIDKINAYQQSQIQTLPPAKLVDALYEGTIKFISQAQKSLEQRNLEQTNYYLGRAQDIFTELMVTLDYGSGGEIARNLYQLYDFMYRHLVAANVKKDSGMMEDVKKMVRDLQQTWEEAMSGLQGGGLK